ncbi:MAG: phosphoglucosamine mutase, partial [Acidobacteria bacterium]|nr:phosphoglucosamine mutase [Acidobacteriota bacterium]
MNPLFGTDGIRGRVGAYPLDPSTLFVLGTSLAKSLTGATGHKPRLISARDTRESGPEIEAMLCSGIIAAGGSLVSAGVLPTPAVAFLVEEYGFDGGIVVSASHNPHEDNGIKVFSGAGRKLDDRMEDAIAEEVIRLRESAVPAPRSRPDQDPGLGTAYERHLLTLIRPRLDLVACKLVVDCANGAASRLAPGVLEKLGAQVHAIHDSPNGVNINLACGALHLDGLISEVIARRFDMGVAFDGDADR